MSPTMTRNMTLAAALADAEQRYSAANPESLARHEQACRSMPGGNTRTVIFYPPFPLTMARGEGAFLWDLDGHRYRDFLGEYSAGLYGHSTRASRRRWPTRSSRAWCWARRAATRSSWPSS